MPETSVPGSVKARRSAALSSFKILHTEEKTLNSGLSPRQRVLGLGRVCGHGHTLWPETTSQALEQGSLSAALATHELSWLPEMDRLPPDLAGHLPDHRLFPAPSVASEKRTAGFH